MAMLVKTLNGLAYASVKTRRGLAVASIKNINGLDATAGGGGPALIASVGAQGSANSTTTSAIDTTGANLIVICETWYKLATFPTLTDSKGNTWTQLTAQTGNSGKHRLFYCFNPTVGSGHTFSETGGGTGSTYAALNVSAWSGIAASPFDGENGAFNDAASVLSTGSVTPTQGNSLLISGCGNDSAATLSIDSGYTITDTVSYSSGNSFGQAMAYKIISSGAAQNPQWSASAAVELQASIAAFKY